MKIGRRSLIKGVGAAGIALQFTGFASASGGQARYITRTRGYATDAVEAEGFEVLNELAGGEILLAKGPSDAVETLEDIDDVAEAVRDFAVEFEDPAVEASGDDAHPDNPEEVYDEYQWDKQIQQVREAQEYATGAGRTIAIVDTGIDDAHPDLDVDVEKSATIREGQVDPHTGDASYHGTHIAGIAAATGDRRASSLTGWNTTGGSAPLRLSLTAMACMWVGQPTVTSDVRNCFRPRAP